MDKNTVDEAKAKFEAQSAWLKLLLILIAVAIVGTVVCVILWALRVAVQGVAITACILLAIGLVGLVCYNGLKYRIQAGRYKHQIEQQERRNLPNE